MPAEIQSNNVTATVSLVRSNPDRAAGVLAPLFSLRTEDDLGIGDVEGLRQFVGWAADAGFGFVQLLPINETGPDNSPYNAISSVALEPMTLDCSPGGLEDLPESVYGEVTEQHGVNRLRQGPVQYDKVRALKLDLMWRAFSEFYGGHYQKGTPRDREFHGFGERERAWLGDYCLFRLLMDMEGGSQVWQEWSEDFNTIVKARAYVSRLLEAEPVKTERQLVYYAYVQWIADRQWKAVRQHADERGVELMGDIPIGVSMCSVDVFANPEIFDLDWYGGAPPERLFKDDPFVQKWGQNWGIPLYHWDVLEERDFDWWRQRVRKVSEIFSLFRIDHTLGFYRIYGFPWNPIENDSFFPLSEEEAADRCDGRRPGFQPRPDDTDENCAANRADGEKYLRMIQDAAGEGAVIAEDLGVVPDYVRPSLAELGIPGMKVPHWEHEEGDGALIAGADYPEVSFATFATHDHAPMRAQWAEQYGKLKGAERDSGEWWEAKRFLDDLCNFAGIERAQGSDDTDYPEYDEVRESLFRALYHSNSRYAAVMITDLLNLEERFNVPGVMDGSNWSFRLAPTVRELAQAPQWVEAASQTRKVLIESRRAASLAAPAISLSQPNPEVPKPTEKTMSEPITVAVTGAAGQIGYALLFRIASGAMFGPDQPVKLHLIEIEPAMKALEGVVMELDDCAFPLLHGIEATSDLNAGFNGVNWSLLVGSVPRKAGMERKDLLGINGKIFTGQGQAIAANAASDARTLVVGNPCNTNCLIAMNNADGVSNDRWFAMTRLDENRAKTQLAQKAGVHVSAVSNMTIWGNHSATQYPDFTNAKINGAPATDAISDQAWLEGAFIETVQKRGAAIIEARGLSSAASAANGVVDTVRSLTTPTAEGDWNSVCVCSDGSYGIDEGLIASFPIRSDGENWNIVEGVPVDEFSRGKIDATVAELSEEREAVKELGLLPD